MNNTQLKELPDILEELVFDEEPVMGLEGEVEKLVADSISKILYRYLEEHLKADKPLAKSVDKWLKLAVYIQEIAKR